MYALVEDNTITKTYTNPRGMTIGGIQYPQNIHSLWSESDLNAIGIYTLIYDDTNKRDGDWYINTNQTLTFAGGVVTATYGTATAKLIGDMLPLIASTLKTPCVYITSVHHGGACARGGEPPSGG